MKGDRGGGQRDMARIVGYRNVLPSLSAKSWTATLAVEMIYPETCYYLVTRKEAALTKHEKKTGLLISVMLSLLQTDGYQTD